MEGAISTSVLEAASLRFQRHLASTLIAALSESGISTQDAETLLEWKRGSFMRYINRLVGGKDKGLRSYSDLATALGVQITIGFEELRFLQPREQKETV